MSKAYAKTRAEEKKKNSSASSQSSYEKSVQIYNQQKQQDLAEAERLRSAINAQQDVKNQLDTLSGARNYYGNIEAYRQKLQALRGYGYNTSDAINSIGGGAGRMVNALQNISQAQYLHDIRFPQKYAGQGIGNINLAIQRLSNGNAQQRAEAEWLKQHRLDYVDTNQLQRAQRTNANAIERMTADRNQYHGAARSNWYDKNREQYDAAKAASGQLNRAIYERTYGDLLEKMPTALKNNLINVAGKAQAWEGKTTEENRKNAQGYVQVRSDLKKAGYTDDQIAGLMDYARRQYNATATAADIQKWADRIDGGFWNGAGASAASVPMNLAGGVAGYLDMAGQRLLGSRDPVTGTRKPIDYNSGANRFSNVSSGIRAAVGEHLNGFQNFLYQTGMSMGDFGLAALTGQAEILLAGSAAQQATQEAHLRGASDDQALFVGLLSGAAEAAFEHLSIENLRGIKNAVNKGMLGGKFLARAVGLQSLTEGSEEGLTTIANLISDAILMGDESQVNQQIRENILNGMSEKDATVSAWTEQAKGLLMDIAGGMLSGALIGGAQTGISAAQFGAVNRSVQNVLESAQKVDADLKAVRTMAKEKYGEQAKAVESVFEAGTADAETFQRQFQTAYDLGKEGAALDVVMNTPATADLNELQRENAWLIGRDAGIREGTIKEEANANGETVRVRGSGERNSVQGAAGQVQQVEGNAGSYQEGRSLGIGRSAKDGAAADLRYSEEVKSARDLGIENGAVIKNLRTVDESSYTPEMQQYAQEMAATGHKVTYVSGLIHAQDGPGGMITRARGMVNGNGDVFVQVDDERFTAIQIGKHEDGHLRIARGEIDLVATKDAVRKSMSEERFDRAMQDYAEAYAGLDMTEDKIWKEIVCDAQGEMNIFEGTALKKEYDRNARIAEAVRQAVRENAGEQKADGTRAPPEGKQKMSADLPNVDSDGKALTEQQAAFFAESKVRTDSGALKVMYRGGNTDIEVFDRRKSKPSNLYGRGFYFTDSEEHAGQYGNATAYYLNITNPLSPGQHKITRAQMRAFLEAVQENDEDYDFVNYGQGASVSSVLSDLFGKGDMEMLQDVNATAIGDFVAAVELFNEVNGTDYDGIIVPTETVAFRSEQIKRTDNKNPTANPNVEFSRELDDRYMQAVESGNRRTANQLVQEAALEWGAASDESGKPIKLYRGTNNFGRTIFQTRLIFGTTSRSVASGYGGAGGGDMRGLSRERSIKSAQDYKPDNGDLNQLIKNAKGILGSDLHIMSDQEVAERKEELLRKAREINDAVNEAWVYGDDFHPPESIRNDMDYPLMLFGDIIENDNLYFSEDPEERETWIHEFESTYSNVLERYNRVRDYFSEHRKEILNSSVAPLFKLAFSGYEFSDTLIDIMYSYARLMKPGTKIANSEGNPVDIKALRDSVEFNKDSGIYTLYGNLGEKPLVIDAEKAHWSSVRVDAWDGKHHLTDEIADWAKKNGYTSVVIKNIMDPGVVNVLGDDYIFWNRNQVKSADTVTYDDNGNIIPLSERFNPEQTDIRYSRETELDQLARENRALQKETDELRKAVQKWKSETKRTERYSAREEDVRRSAKDLIKTLNSMADAAEITADMKALAEYIMNGEDGESASWLTVREMADRIADKVVGAERVNIRGDVFDEYKRLTEILKGKTLHIDPEAVADLQGYENLQEFNRENMGTMRLTAKAMKPGDKSVQDAYYEMIEAMPGWFPEDASTDAERVANMLEVLDGLRPVYGMSDETSYHYDEAVTWAANDVIDRVLDESIRQMPKTFADKAQAKYDKERARLYQRIRNVREQGNERLERAKREYAARSNAAIDRMRQRQEKQIADLKARQKAKERNARDRRDTTATWHKIQKIGAKFRQMVEHPAQAASKHAPRELAKALQGVADVFYTENRRRSNQTVNAAIQNLAVQFDALKDTEQGIYYDPMLAELNRAAEKALLNVPANEMTPEQIDAVYRLLRAHMNNITSANKFVTGRWAKTIWETGRDWAREVDGASPIMKGWTGDFLNWQLRPDSFFKRISGFAKDSVGERVQKMFSDGTEKMLRIQQDAYYTFREFTESKQFGKLSKRGKGDLADVGLKDADGKPVLLTRDMMLAVYMNLRNEQNLQAASYGGIEVPNFDEYYTGKTSTSYRHRTTTANVGGETLELQNERRDLEHSLRSGELSEEAAEEARTRLQEIEDEIRQRADEIVGQMLKVRSNIENELTDYEKRFAKAAAEWMRKSADYLNAETTAMYGIEKAQVPNYWPLHRDLSFVNTDMRTITDEINLENVGFLKERVQSRAPIMLAGFTFELENQTRRVSQYCGFAAVQRDFNKLYNTKLTREGSSLERKIRDKFGDEQRKMGASGQQYIDAYIASVSGADKADATVFSLIRRNLPRATLTLNLRVAVSQLASMPTAAAEIGWGSVAKGLPRGLKTAFSRKAKAELAAKNPWFWQRYRGEGGMREFADMHEERNWLDRTWNKFAGLPVVRNLVNWCQDFDVFATASMWAMSEEWVKSSTDYKPGTEEFDRAVSEKYADVIRKTQPNYTVTERSGLLRDKREGYKLLTMYKTQSNQNLNVLYDANATLIKYKKDLKAGRNGVTKEDVKAAQRQFARAYTAVILGGSVSLAILRAGANAILHAMNSYRDDDDEVTLESTLNGILSETASAMAGMFAFGSAVYDVIHALVSGEKYYGLSESAIEALSNLAEQSMTIAQKAIDRDKDVEQKDVEKLVKNACNILGLPWNNAQTIVEGVVNHVKDAQNGEFLSFEAGVERTAKQEANRIIDGYLVGAGDRVKRAWDELLELKGDEEKAQSAMRSAVQGAYVAGDLTDKQAADLLRRYGGAKEKDATAKVLEYQCERDTGVKYSKLKEAYLDGELTESAAKKALVKYGSKDSEAAEKTVTGWAAEKDIGFALGELKEAYLGGDISRDGAIQARVKYGGVEPEKAEEDALKWDVEKEYGIEYGVQNVQEAVAAGTISEADARTIWTQYGGKTEEDADELIAAANFKAAHSDVDLDDVTASRIQIFDQYAPEGTDAAQFMSYAAQIRKDQNAGKYPGIPDGKGGKKPYSVMDAVAEWINSLPISGGEKTALLLTYTNGKTTSLSRYNWS